jgi:hypothetical protein
MRHLTSHAGRYQWDAKVSGFPVKDTNAERRIIRITIFADERAEAAQAAINEVAQCGFERCNLNHITKIGNRQ